MTAAEIKCESASGLSQHSPRCHSSSRLDEIASDIETCKHVSASLGSYVIPFQGLTAAVIQYERKRSCCPTLLVIPATEPESCRHLLASFATL